jgi:hypothetical protein
MWSIFTSPKVPKAASRGGTIYNWVLGRRFDPGAPGEVFQPELNNPVVLFRGRARLAGALGVFQHPQVWVVADIGVTGLGGIQAGQYVGQPLIDPSQTTPEYEGG